MDLVRLLESSRDNAVQQVSIEQGQRDQEALKLAQEDNEFLVHANVVMLLRFLFNHVGPGFLKETTQKKSLVSKCFAELFCQILDSFQVLLFMPSLPFFMDIFKYSIHLLCHSDNSVSSFSLDIWINLKASIKNEKERLTPEHVNMFRLIYEEVGSI